MVHEHPRDVTFSVVHYHWPYKITGAISASSKEGDAQAPPSPPPNYLVKLVSGLSSCWSSKPDQV